MFRLKCRLARDRDRAAKLRTRLGLPSEEVQEKQNAINAADKMLAELKVQMEELNRQAEEAK